jgi:hypothetical protein
VYGCARVCVHDVSVVCVVACGLSICTVSKKTINVIQVLTLILKDLLGTINYGNPLVVFVVGFAYEVPPHARFPLGWAMLQFPG